MDTDLLPYTFKKCEFFPYGTLFEKYFIILNGECHGDGGKHDYILFRSKSFSTRDDCYRYINEISPYRRSRGFPTVAVMVAYIKISVRAARDLKRCWGGVRRRIKGPAAKRHGTPLIFPPYGSAEHAAGEYIFHSSTPHSAIVNTPKGIWKWQKMFL